MCCSDSAGDTTDDEFFRISEDGLITLESDADRGMPDVELLVIGTNNFGSSTGTVKVEFIGINTPPKFPSCSQLAASVAEGVGEGYSVENVRTVHKSARLSDS